MRQLFTILAISSVTCFGQPSVHIDSTLSSFKRAKLKETRAIDDHRTLMHMRCKTDTGKVDVFIDYDKRNPGYGKFLYNNGRPLRKAKIISYKGWRLTKFFQVRILGTDEVFEYRFKTGRWRKHPSPWHKGESHGTERPDG